MSEHPRPQRRPGEQLVDAARRVAADAVGDVLRRNGTPYAAGAVAANVVLALLEPIDEHLVDVGEDSFTVTHPLTERFEGRMHECSVHQWMRTHGEPPAPPGRYRAVRREPSTYSEDLGAEPWELVPVDAGGAS